MRKSPLHSRVLRSLALALLATAFAGPAGAGSLYRWVTDDGVLSFTDDPDRIPPRYQPQARTQPRARLRDHARFTPTDGSARSAYAARLAERIERLREFNAPVAGTASAAFQGFPSPRHAVTVRTGNDTGFEFEVEEDAAPLIVERRRLVDAETSFTRHVTIVRQGDRIVSIVKPRSHFAQPPWDTIQDLESGR